MGADVPKWPCWAVSAARRGVGDVPTEHTMRTNTTPWSLNRSAGILLGGSALGPLVEDQEASDASSRNRLNVEIRWLGAVPAWGQ